MKKVLFIQDFYQESDVKNKKVFSSSIAQNFLNTLRGLDVQLFFDTVHPLLDVDDVKPTTEQAREGRQRISEKILELKPDIVVPLGKYIMKIMTGSINFGSEMGSVLHITKFNTHYEHECLVIPMYHPEKVLIYPEFMDKVNRALGILINEIKRDTVLDHTLSVTDRVLKGLDYHSLETVDDVKKGLESMKNAPIVAVDIETTGLEWWLPTSKVICISFSYKHGQGYVIPLDKREQIFSPQDLEIVKGLIKDFLNSDVRFVGHNLKFDTEWLKATYDWDIKNWTDDTQYMHFLAVSEEPGTQSLKYNAVLYTDMGNYETELEEFKKTLPKEEQGNYDNVPWNILRKYATADTDACLRLYYLWKPLIEANKDWKWLYDNVYIPVAKALREIEMNGMHMDLSLSKKYEKTYTDELNRLSKLLNNNSIIIEIEREKQALFAERERIKLIPKKERTAEEQEKFTKYTKYKNYKFLWSSSQELRYLLFERLGLPVVSRTKKGEPSTDEEALTELAKLHEIPKLLLKWRKVDTLKKMFIDVLPTMATKEGIIHPTFGIHLTVTGRTNCKDPKLAVKLGS